MSSLLHLVRGWTHRHLRAVGQPVEIIRGHHCVRLQPLHFRDIAIRRPDGDRVHRDRLVGLQQINKRALCSLADRRSDSAALHGRHRWAALPRIRGDTERDHSRFRRRIADANADDVLTAAQGQIG